MLESEFEVRLYFAYLNIVCLVFGIVEVVGFLFLKGTAPTAPLPVPLTVTFKALKANLGVVTWLLATTAVGLE